MTKEAAEKLYIGVVSDTNRFMFSYTSFKTFDLISKLIKKTNIDFTSLYEALYLRQIKEVRFEGYIANNLKISDNGMAYIVIDEDVLNKYETFVELYSNGFPFVDAEKFGDEKFEYYKIDSGFIPEMHKSRRPIKNLASLLTDDNYKIEMFDVFFRNQAEREKCKAELLEKYGDIEITTSMDNNLEIMKKGVNKGTGLLNLSKISKI